MKAILLKSIFLLSLFFSLAFNDYVEIDDVYSKTCRVRACWYTDTGKKCTPWQEVPCDTQVEVVVKEY